MSSHFIISVDNRDQKTTTLTLSAVDGSKGAGIITVDIDPVDLFENMLENCFGQDRRDTDDLDTSLLDAMSDFLSDLVNKLAESKDLGTQEEHMDEYDEVQVDKIDLYRKEH